jgi:hypothetical protein
VNTEPLHTFLRIACHEDSDWLPDAVEAIRKRPRTDYAVELRRQLQDPVLLDQISDPSVLEDITGYDFDSREDARHWLDALYRHIFEDGPPPDSV